VQESYRPRRVIDPRGAFEVGGHLRERRSQHDHREGQRLGDGREDDGELRVDQPVLSDLAPV